ncbi:MAG: carbohydrate ABC transporter permease [Endomicrobiia bacterium]
MQKAKDIFTSYLFILPALVMFVIFSIYPFYKVFQLSVFDWDGISPIMKFVGLNNFKNIFLHDTPYWISMRNAGFITLLALTFQNFLAFLLAYIVDKEIKGRNFYRTIFFLPPVLSGIVVGLVWSWIYNSDYGLLNRLLKFLGLAPQAWLTDPKFALISVSIIHMWKGFGWGFVILLAGLQGIPRELYEAAKVDGASGWQIVTSITIPIMMPIFFLVSILTILGSMQIYDIIVSTTGGGPGYHTEVPITRILASMIGSSRFGYAAAQGIVFGVILLVLSILQIKISRKLQV